MSVQLHPRRPWPTPGEVFYPETDGKPMTENTLQYRWMVLLIENIRNVFAHDPGVFVAGDLLWYPVQGQVDLCLAPDCMVVFGRPRGDRRSYKQWEEGGLPPQVVFEVLSPANTTIEMTDQLRDYERYGVEEVYYYDPETRELRGWLRREGRLTPVAQVEGWESPRLKIRFWPGAGELKIERPDGTAFESFEELAARAHREHERAERLAERLRTLGVDPDVT
jgi:Uma2 family endonuclease